MEVFGTAHGFRMWGEGGQGQLGRGLVESPVFPKICRIYHTMMILGALIPYLQKIQKIYKNIQITQQNS